MPEAASKNKIESNREDAPKGDRSSPVTDDWEGEAPAEPATDRSGGRCETVSCRSSGRFWWGVIAGGVVTVPLAWLLAHAATLPFFIGLFFFALFGLVIGAVVHRVASPGRPYKHGVVLTGTIAIIAGGWLTSIVFEGRSLPTDLARDLPDRTLSLGGLTRGQFVEAAAGQIRSYLRDHYPPGGTIGYIRWVITSGELPKGTMDRVRRTLRVPQRKGWWVMRVLLSIGLFSFGVSSQTLLLRLARDPAAVRASELENG